MIVYNYVTTCLINNKKYIGMHSTDNVDDGYLGSGRYLLKAIKKYGKENFIREVLCFCKTVEEAFKNEAVFIKEYNTLVSENGYNISPTGGFGLRGQHSNESRLRMSEAQSGENNPMYGKKGKNNPNYGKCRSGESKYRMSEAHKGVLFSEEHKKNIGRGNTGRVVSNKTKKLISDANKGRCRTPEVKKKLSEIAKGLGRTGENNPTSKPLLQYHVNKEFVQEWECAREACRETGIGHTSINNCLYGRSMSAGGYIWKFKETKNK